MTDLVETGVTTTRWANGVNLARYVLGRDRRDPNAENSIEQELAHSLIALESAYSSNPWTDELTRLRAALAAAEARAVPEGWPTEEMLRAAARVYADMVGAPYDDWRHFTGEVQRICSAMLSAAPQPPQQSDAGKEQG